MRWIWIDKFTEFTPRTSATAIKNVSLAEEHLHDLFPDFPIVPHSLIVEGYAQTGWRLGEVLLNPAARVSWNSRWGAAFTPSVAAAWDATPSLRFRAGVARGFRGPSFKELAWDFPNPFAGYTIRGDPGLTPERSWQPL